MYSVRVSYVLTTISAIMMMIMSSGATATPILIGDNEQAFGIKNLQVNEKQFDVSFSNFGSFDRQSDESPFFLGDEAGARSALEAVLEVLNEFEVTGVSNISFEQPFVALIIVFDLDDLKFEGAVAASDDPHDGNWRTASVGRPSRNSNFGNASFVNFSELQQVNAPSILFLTMIAAATIFFRRAF